MLNIVQSETKHIFLSSVGHHQAPKPKNARVLYVQYTNPAGYPPLEHSSTILAEDGWQVVFLGTEALGVDKLAFPPNPNISVQKMPFCKPGFRQKLHYLQFVLWTILWTLRWRPNWIYASDLFSCPIALSLKQLFPTIKVIYHEHDTPSQTDSSGFLRLCLQTRKLLARQADICILPNQQRIEHFIDETACDRKKVICVWNCPTKAEASLHYPERSDPDLRLVYHGSIVPSRLPETVLHAIAKLPNTVKLKVIGYETTGFSGYVQTLKTCADRLGISAQVDFLGTLPRSSLLEQCRQCDVGLSLFSDNTIEPMLGASNKPFDNLACGLPLLVSSVPDWEQFYVEPGYALACNPNDSASIVEALKHYLDYPLDMRQMGDRGRQRILEQWNYEQQFTQILRQMNRTVTDSDPKLV
jgi:glycosyltransferase involved in cell wall biosynthesis